MEKQTAKALWQSIEHWHENWADPEEADIYGESCSLCHRFDKDYCKTYSGEKCPVAIYTGRPDCKGSPWADVRDAFADKDLGENITESELRGAMGKEIEFLVDLVPDP